MKTIVVYDSKTGFTEKYAKWIGEELCCEVRSKQNVDADSLFEYDNIIFGGGLYSWGIHGIRLIKNNLDDLFNSNIIVFATGLATKKAEELSSIWDLNFTKSQQRNIKFFYFRGGIDFSKLNGIDKRLTIFMANRYSKKKSPTESQREVIRSIHEPLNFCKKENIEPLIDCVFSL